MSAEGDWRQARHEKGAESVKQVLGPKAEESLATLGELGDRIIETIYGDIYQRDGLTLKERQIATLCMLMALGGKDRQVKVHMRAGMRVGITEDELRELVKTQPEYDPEGSTVMAAVAVLRRLLAAAKGDRARRGTKAPGATCSRKRPLSHSNRTSLNELNTAA